MARSVPVRVVYPMLGPEFPPHTGNIGKGKGGSGSRSKGEQWARSFSSCQGCGTITEPHVSLGLCRPCYTRHRRLRRALEGLTR